MRKILCTGFTFALLTLALASAPKAGAADYSNCRYTCSCTGTPLRCCTSGGVETCKPTTEILCPQVITC
jgi:hypothetical protein